MESIVKLVYYGRDLKEAYDNCMSDSSVYDENVESFQVISVRRVCQNFKVQWEGREDEEVEAWEFEVFLIPAV